MVTEYTEPLNITAERRQAIRVEMERRYRESEEEGVSLDAWNEEKDAWLRTLTDDEAVWAIEVYCALDGEASVFYRPAAISLEAWQEENPEVHPEEDD